jgi:hypothetical protein
MYINPFWFVHSPGTPGQPEQAFRLFHYFAGFDTSLSYLCSLLHAFHRSPAVSTTSRNTGYTSSRNLKTGPAPEKLVIMAVLSVADVPEWHAGYE